MPRPPIKNVTRAGTDTVILSAEQRDRIVAALATFGYDPEASKRFADAANRAAVDAYELEHQLSTPGALRRWHSSMLKAIDRRDFTFIRQLLSESADEFPRRLHLECQLLADSGELPLRIENLRVYCDAELTRLSEREGRTKRRRSCRQILAEELTTAWWTQFDELPVYYIGTRLPPFLDVLKEVMLLAEIHYHCKLPLDDSDLIDEDMLQNLAKSARAAEKKRARIESQFAE